MAQEIPQYELNHQVKALKIKEVLVIGPNPWYPNGSRNLIFDEPHIPVVVTPDFYATNRPVAGDYYVIYPDGHSNTIPEATFESIAGSGTGRWPNQQAWTEAGDGTDYPGEPVNEGKGE
jgi:hypothetical protein